MRIVMLEKTVIGDSAISVIRRRSAPDRGTDDPTHLSSAGMQSAWMDHPQPGRSARGEFDPHYRRFHLARF